jgi:hypothetical protein
VEEQTQTLKDAEGEESYYDEESENEDKSSDSDVELPPTDQVS